MWMLISPSKKSCFCGRRWCGQLANDRYEDHVRSPGSHEPLWQCWATHKAWQLSEDPNGASVCADGDAAAEKQPVFVMRAHLWPPGTPVLETEGVH